MRRCTPSDIVPAGPSSPEWWRASSRISYRQARWHLRNARRYATILATLLSLRSTPVRRVRLALSAMLESLESARWWRANARSSRRQAVVFLPSTLRPGIEVADDVGMSGFVRSP